MKIASFCAICITGTAGLHLRMLSDRGPLFTLCDACDPVCFPGLFPNHTVRNYQPTVGEPISMPMRVLRAMRRFDWVSPMDLYDALDLPGVRYGRVLYNSFSVALSRLYRIRRISRRSQICSGPGGFVYRIRPAGIRVVERWEDRSCPARSGS